MPRPLRYTLIGLLWAAVAGYIVYSAARVRTHRRQLVVQRLDIEIADSSSHGQLVTGGAVRQWLARSGVKTVGAAAREVDLRSIEGLILRNGFVADATASIDYGGVLRIAVRQRRPVVRLLFDGYNAYATDEGYLFAAYVGLIITNCIVMGRIEAFALANKPWASLLDGIGNGLGYGLILVIVAFFRELFGSGTLMGWRIIPESWYAAEGGWYYNNGLMLFPPMALIIVGCIIWVHRSRNKDLQEK